MSVKAGSQRKSKAKEVLFVENVDEMNIASYN
jgi:hypothetical protein